MVFVLKVWKHYLDGDKFEVFTIKCIFIQQDVNLSKEGG